MVNGVANRFDNGLGRRSAKSSRIDTQCVIVRWTSGGSVQVASVQCRLFFLLLLVVDDGFFVPTAGL